ncbi:hypothetical protein PLESTB_001732800 [Pleodorina starrii]|uniref:DUF2177 family protein n=1 Tax=Pleodorina starrii TaxID=330485 RepID=A0A9W6BZP4_9CHLO|nr:hypothetical protein PLESTM_000735300 [Pleodorina starrii]GLC61223.1 hypothetical protein PLESTB_001732800 [Pleodorina starrii]GLC76886.1 hypothetical protein PLESTF_001851700 [Pleodorina starrii]
MYVPLEENMAAPNVPLWKSLLLVFLPSLVVFVLLDVTWISLVAGSIYKSVLGDLLRPTPLVVPGLVAWLCIVGSVYIFALPGARTPTAALRQGLLLGVGLYGTYEFTNLSILGPWTWALAAADTAWGATACGVAAVLQLWLTRRLAAA